MPNQRPPLCKKCNCADPAQFYPYQPGECKPCIKARVIANRLANVGYYRAFDIVRNRTDKRKIVFKAKTKAKRASMGPDYMRAHNAVTRAVKAGRMVRPATCSRCPSTVRIQAHHDDYARALDVLWLCPVCHAARHAEIKQLRKAV